MVEVGVDVVDVNSMLYSVTNYTARGTHYLIVNPGEQTVKGNFGARVAHYINFKLCQNVMK